jgi:hypothetical protein
VVDCYKPKGIETEKDVIERKHFLRKVGGVADEPILKLLLIMSNLTESSLALLGRTGNI